MQINFIKNKEIIYFSLVSFFLTLIFLGPEYISLYGGLSYN